MKPDNEANTEHFESRSRETKTPSTIGMYKFIFFAIVLVVVGLLKLLGYDIKMPSVP
jgi:hypothetical protein